jgi:hypothetical protein
VITLLSSALQVDQCLVDGANEQLQLLDLLAFMNRRLKVQSNEDPFVKGPGTQH